MFLHEKRSLYTIDDVSGSNGGEGNTVQGDGDGGFSEQNYVQQIKNVGIERVSIDFLKKMDFITLNSFFLKHALRPGKTPVGSATILN